MVALAAVAESPAAIIAARTPENFSVLTVPIYTSLSFEI
jgi:hypothetical protein